VDFDSSGGGRAETACPVGVNIIAKWDNCRAELEESGGLSLVESTTYVRKWLFYESA
jgi:hypothetical protein